MIERHHKNKIFYGTSPLGEKGQVVIPVEARMTMKIKKGDKLLIFGMGTDVLIFSKISNLEKMASHLSSRLKGIQELIKRNK